MAQGLNRARARGFTLIELLITMTIVAILAAVAYPSYAESVRKGKRASAKAAMTEVAGRLQQFYSEQSGAAKYTDDLTLLQYGTKLMSEANGHEIVISAADASSYTITAKPVADDPKCGNLTLNHLGTFLPADC